MKLLCFAGKGNHQTNTVPGETLVEFNLDIPIGQLFVKSADTSRHFTELKCVTPARTFFPSKEVSRGQNYRVIHYAGNQGNENQAAAQIGTNASQGVYSYRIESSQSLGHAEDIIWEFHPNPLQNLRLNFFSGYGSSRLDLSNLKLSHLHVESGVSDVIITYSQPNRTEMDDFIITGGMGKITLRNIEMARAKHIKIENGLGETLILIGNYCSGPSTMVVTVGAGRCILMADPDVPLRIVINKSFLSTVHIPESFMQTASNDYINPKFKSTPAHAITLMVDVGIGDFTLIPSGK